MIYGFMDESGAPGVATNGNDFLVVDSRVNDLVQIADYVVNMSAKDVAGRKIRRFEKIKDKQLALVLKTDAIL